MSASVLIRKAGFNVLLATNGEALTPGGFKAVVNRKVTKLRDTIAARDGNMDFSILGMSEIEFLIAGANQPMAGDNFVDKFGLAHRVRYVMATDITWVCYCTQSQLPANLVPAGAVYSPNPQDLYHIGAVLGGVYEWVKGANDVSITDGTQVLTANGTFVAGNMLLTLAGVQGTPPTPNYVTATLTRIS